MIGRHTYEKYTRVEQFRNGLISKPLFLSGLSSENGVRDTTKIHPLAPRVRRRTETIIISYLFVFLICHISSENYTC